MVRRLAICRMWSWCGSRPWTKSATINRTGTITESLRILSTSYGAAHCSATYATYLVRCCTLQCYICYLPRTVLHTAVLHVLATSYGAAYCSATCAIYLVRCCTLQCYICLVVWWSSVIFVVTVVIPDRSGAGDLN